MCPTPKFAFLCLADASSSSSHAETPKTCQGIPSESESNNKLAGNLISGYAHPGGVPFVLNSIKWIDLLSDFIFSVATK
jgi:hypothetical protein